MTIEWKRRGVTARPKGVSRIKVSVIGGAGHVGFPLTLVLAASGMETIGIDIDERTVQALNRGESPFFEKGAGELLTKYIDTPRLQYTSDIRDAGDSDFIIVVIGTPLGEHSIPNTKNLFKVIQQLSNFITKDQVIVIRSTVTPGTTRTLQKMLFENRPDLAGTIFGFVYAPERALQGQVIDETRQLPQIIGMGTHADGKSFCTLRKKVRAFFTMFVRELRWVTFEEAEIGKLFTNIYRYVQFAFSNEMLMVAQEYGADIHRVIAEFKRGYPRFNPPSPGANVGGPCLRKDIQFLTWPLSFTGIMQASQTVNESMPAYMVFRALMKKDLKICLIVGATFKRDCDDTRESLTPKLAEVLENKGIKYRIYDSVIHQKIDKPHDFDAIFLMTPHTKTPTITDLHDMLDHASCNPIIYDAWNHWKMGFEFYLHDSFSDKR